MSEGYASHSPPIYEAHHDDVPSHYEIPNECGYFPAAASSTIVASIHPATLYQMHPDYDKKLDHPIATGTLTLSDPAEGTADEVALVGDCDGLLFYILCEDATTRTSETDFMLLLPHDCILVDVTGAEPETTLHLEALLAARTQFHDETKQASSDNELVYPEILPDDVVSRGMYRTSKFVSRMIVGASGKVSKSIEAYGEKKRDGITAMQEKQVGKTSIKMAKATRRASDVSLRVSTKVSEKISDVIGGGVGRAVSIKEGDAAPKRKARQLLLASTIAIGEVNEGIGRIRTHGDGRKDASD